MSEESKKMATLTRVIGYIYLYLKITNELVFFPECDSDLVLMCGSDRSIQVFDMNKGEVATVLPDAHSRAAHCISQNKVSSYHRYCNNNLIIIHYHIAKKPQ